MKEINALKLRNNLGEILDQLNTTGEPVVINKGRKAKAVLITPEQFEKRFLDYHAEEKKKEMLEKILALRGDRIGNKDSVAILRELRGYEE
jgi:prevent-host-death family protein